MNNKNRIIHFVIFVGILIGYFCLTKFVTYTSAMIYNAMALFGSEYLLFYDFDIELFKRGGNVFKAFLKGSAFAFIFAITLFVVVWIFQDDVTLIAIYDDSFYSFGNLFRFFLMQALVAVSEEAFFRFYLYEFLKLLFKHTLPAVLVVSLIFAGLHYWAHGIPKQVIVALLFSLYVFYIRSKKGNDSFYTLCFAHFMCNCLSTFVFHF